MTNIIYEMLTKSPLIAVSAITEMQSKYLIKLGNELVSSMEAWNSQKNNFEHVYYQYWLWVLGTYEVTRTMSEHQNKIKFIGKTQRKIFQFKRYITKIRIPFAKQKISTNKGEAEIKAFSELMVNDTEKDMLFEIKGVKYSAKESIEKFKNLISNIKITDIK